MLHSFKHNAAIFVNLVILNIFIFKGVLVGTTNSFLFKSFD